MANHQNLPLYQVKPSSTSVQVHYSWRKDKICFLIYALLMYLLIMVVSTFSYCYLIDWCTFTALPERQLGSSRSTAKVQWIPACRCFRRFFYDGPMEGRPVYLSSCSDEGTFYQEGQKVVSYSLYVFPSDPVNKTTGFFESYRNGIWLNLEAMRKNYPGYTMRVYTDRDPSQIGYCDLLCGNADLFWCNITDSPSLGNKSKVYFTTWRFFPLGDYTVDVFLSRDLDSLLIEREAAVVTDWLQLPERKAIHLMRDNQAGHLTAILGGMWGARNSYFPRLKDRTARRTLDNILKHSYVPNFAKARNTGFDQMVLKYHLFAPFRNFIVAYDSYSCRFYGQHTMVRPFPVQRKDNETDFVGNTNFGRTRGRLPECPRVCRPSYGQNWTYC